MSDHEYPKYQITDDVGNTIGHENLFPALEQGLRRRVARIYLFNEHGEILLSRRSAHILYPLLLDQSAGGHVDEGEAVEDCARRELEEELGVRNVSMQEILATTYDRPMEKYGIGKSYDHCFIGKISKDTEINFDTHEVAEVMWIHPQELIQDLQKHPEKYTSGMVDLFPKVYELLR